MSLVLVEGLDRTGKSTFCERLKAHWEAAGRSPRLTHYSAPEQPTAFLEYLAPLLEYDPRTDDVILDRCHIGELVWPTFFGRPAIMTEAERELIELFVMMRGGIYVYTQRPLDDIHTAFEEGEEPLDSGMIPAANKAYDEAFGGVKTYVVKFDLGKHGDHFEKVADAADEQARICEHMVTPRSP